MAKIILTVDSNIENAQKKIETLKTTVTELGKQLRGITFSKDLSQQIQELTKYYEQFAKAAQSVAQNATISQKSISSVETLRKGVANLIGTLQTLKQQYAEGTFNDKSGKEYATTLKEILTTLDGYSDRLKNNEKLTDDETKHIAKLRQQYQLLAAEIAKAKNVSGVKLQTADPFNGKTAETISSMQSRYSNLLRTIQNMQRYYAKGVFAQPTAEARAHLQSLNQLAQAYQTNGQLTAAQQEQLNKLILSYKGVKAATDQAAASNKNYHGTLKDIVSGFLKFQLSAMIVMKPLQMIRNAWQSINETLTETEDKIIALRRVAGDAANANDLYDLAIKFGQTVENVNEAMLTFARRGMSWNESLKATEAALLAVNTADMTVAEATDGLSSVMSQFGIEASKLTEIVDKVNKANDKFPVTSEKILAALQRVGSTASTANLSLDETLGLITTLSKATNRSGQNIGTALNAILNIANKQSTLDTFAKLGADTAKVVDDYRHGIGSILDVLTAVAQKTKDIGDDLDKGSADLAGINDELRESLGEDFEILSDIYGTAGTYRRNYFIALLNDLDTVKSVQQEIADANGYSAKQNEDYLNSYTAKLNSLKAQWQEFVNDEQGLMGLKKLLVDLGEGLLKLTKIFGGMKTVVAALGTVLWIAFGRKILNSIGSFISSLKATVVALMNATTATLTWETAINAVVGAISILITTITAAIGFAQSLGATIENDKNKAIEAWDDISEKATELNRLYNEFEQLASIVNKTTEENEEYSKVEQSIVNLLGTKAVALAGLTKGTDAYREALEKLTNVANVNNKATAQAAANTALDVYNATEFGGLSQYTTHYKGWLSDGKDFDEDTEYKALFDALESFGYSVDYSTATVSNMNNTSRRTFTYGKVKLSDDKIKAIQELFGLQKFLLQNGWGDTAFLTEINESYKARTDSLEEALRVLSELASYENISSNSELDELVKSVLLKTGADKFTGDFYDSYYSFVEGIIISKSGYIKDLNEGLASTERLLENILGLIQSDYVDALQQLYDLEKKATDEAERREKIAEKELAVKEAEQALEDAKNARGVKRVGESGRLEIQQDEKKIAEAEDKLLKAQESLAEETKSFNDWLQQQAWAELKEMFKAGTATNAGVLALLSKYLDKQEGGDSDWANQYLGWIKEVSGVELPSFDNGGIAYGLGAMPKATARPEAVLNPDLTAKILSPTNNEQFERALANIGAMYETGRYYAQAAPVYNNVGATTTTTNDNRVTINGMSLTTEQSNQVLAMFSAMGLVPNNK